MGTQYKQWVNDQRTVLVTLWVKDDGEELMTVAFRPETWQTWGPPVTVRPDE